MSEWMDRGFLKRLINEQVKVVRFLLELYFEDALEDLDKEWVANEVEYYKWLDEALAKWQRKEEVSRDA